MPTYACLGCGRRLYRPGRCSLCRKPQAQRAYRNTAADRELHAQALEEYGPVCSLCGDELDLESINGPLSYALHHAGVAHADGGAYTLDNVRPAHKVCNQRAGRGKAA